MTTDMPDTRIATSHLPAADTSLPIEAPTTCQPYDVGDGITVIPSYLPVPGMGVLPSHAFLVDGAQPLLVDTGPGGTSGGFEAALQSVIDPSRLAWLWLTHTDPDHIGALAWLLDAAPQMRIVTTYLAVGKLGMHLSLPMDRLYWANPGDVVDLGGRRVRAVRPPSFDAPETTALFDATTSTLFSADTFGALLQHPCADAGTLPAGELADGMLLWSTIDSPWVTHTDRHHFDRSLAQLQALGPRRVLSAHLPPADGLTDVLIDNLARVPGATPWTGPDQAALELILAAIGG